MRQSDGEFRVLKEGYRLLKVCFGQRADSVVLAVGLTKVPKVISLVPTGPNTYLR